MDCVQKGPRRAASYTKDLTLQEAVEIALAMETVQKDLKALQGGKDSSANQVAKSQAIQAAGSPNNVIDARGLTITLTIVILLELPVESAKRLATLLPYM